MWNMIRSKHISIVLVVSVAILAVAVGVISILFLINSTRHNRYDKKAFIDSTTYQAVFLTNDQIYFGYLKSISSDYLILFDAYYVKVNESGTGELIKLGRIEPHAPRDEMIINQDHVLFWENLKPDSTVVQKIRSMKL